MHQFTHTLLLIAALAACPMNCLGAFEGKVEEAGSARWLVLSDGSCCTGLAGGQSDARSPDRSGTPQPDDDCGCGSCLCRGAVLSPHDGFWSDSFTKSSCWQAIPISAAGTDFFAQDRSHFDPPERLLSSRAGRPVRILYQSFLL